MKTCPRPLEKPGKLSGKYIKKTVDVHFTPDDTNNYSDKNLEFLYFNILPRNQKKIDVCLVYRQSNGSVVQCIHKIKEMVAKLGLKPNNNELVMLGDFNIDTLSCSKNQTKIINLGRSLNLTQVINDPTRVTHKTSTLIDQCFTNIKHIANCGTVLWSASDHLPIYLVKKKINPEEEKTSFIGRSYVKLSGDEFKEEMDNFTSGLILSEQDPAAAWDIYYGLITSLLSKYCPERVITTKSIRTPYVTNEIIQLSKNRDKLFRKAYKSKNGHDWEQAVLSRSEANIAIRKARRHYISNEVKVANENPIKFWDAMKKLIPSSKSDTIKSVYNENGTTLLYRKEAAT